jgi:hypothetical protein
MAENTYDSLIFIDLFILFIHVTEVMNSSRGKTLNNMEFETKSSPAATSPTIIFLPTPPYGPENLQYFRLEQCRKTGRRQQ